MCWREVHEQQAEEGKELENGRGIEIPAPRIRLNSKPGGNGSDSDGYDGRGIGENDTYVPPLIGEQFRKREGSHLAICTTEASNSHASDDGITIFSCANHEMSDHTDNIASYQKPAPAE